MKDYIVVIPARMQSSRLPGKPLIELQGKSMIQRTFAQCTKAVDKNLIYVATDSEEIYSHCMQNDMQVLMTSEEHLTGTDRVAEVAEKIEAKHYINVQGDEPIFNPADLKETIKALKKYPADIINGYAILEKEAQYKSVTIPKLVFRPDGRLLYMSRSPIPGSKSGSLRKSWRQICIYVFPKKALISFAKCKEKTPLEAEEDIEILRFLELGFEVRMIPLSNDSVAVDTPEDAEIVREILKINDEG
ncbi:3-deoxy-manno-octulosonate cytidylyltransferase [Marivirga harenae]|uniref:3-deoxy-manno-octulosonate cytidylyltransferase n=1 Tax=Marivirga harenae TaxID=2010992 RepID=UPI0026E0E363|nr:3-deoxy-manno-octulosonate cytidylyltransferase [Marivirga harenae]WKV11368.1 3-deoxy-manno-octulosonate cytidylyltransferase [Marivirga harenae]